MTKPQMPGSYKTMFKGMKWDFCYREESPWSEIYVDCDSIIFEYMLEYVQNNLIISYETVGANIFSTKLMTSTIMDDISKNCYDKLECLLKKVDNHVIVFGGEGIEMKQKKMEIYAKSSIDAYNELRTASKTDLGKLRKSLCRYIISQRDNVRNRVKDIMSRKSIICEEPDIYCSQHCMVTFSLDYDLFLFGAKYVIRSIDEDKITFLSRDKLLKNIGLSNMRQLIIASVLCGTDYNTGVKGVGPKKSINIALNDPDSDIIDTKAVSFFLDIIEHSYNESSW